MELPWAFSGHCQITSKYGVIVAGAKRNSEKTILVCSCRIPLGFGKDTLTKMDLLVLYMLEN